MLLHLLNILKLEESFIPWLSPYFKGVDYTLRMANEAVAPLIIVVEGFAGIDQSSFAAWAYTSWKVLNFLSK